MRGATLEKEIVYPDSDGELMADNTEQADLMVFLKTNFDRLFAERPDVFVAMDLLWYPVEGHPEIRVAPDVFVAFDRPKGYRGSYIQWREGGIAPQVVIEILSPGNRAGEMRRKRDFYDRYGVEEYYALNPGGFGISGWFRPTPEGDLVPIPAIENWVSPRLGVRFVAPGNGEFAAYDPDGTPFKSPVDVSRELVEAERERDAAERERDAAERERDAAERERDAAERERDAAERERTDAERQRDAAESDRDKMAARLRELGIDPATL